MGKAFILVVEDHPLFKQALKGLLTVEFPEKTILSAANAEEAFAILDRASAPVLSSSALILDPGLPDISLPELLDQLNARFSTLRTVVVSGSDDPLLVALCLGASVKAFISKLVAPDQIINIVRRLLSDELNNPIWLDIDGERNTENLQHVHLTSRQLEVLYLVCQGMTNRQISDELGVNEITVKVHVSAIFKELGVSSRTLAILAAQRLGLKTSKN